MSWMESSRPFWQVWDLLRIWDLVGGCVGACSATDGHPACSMGQLEHGARGTQDEVAKDEISVSKLDWQLVRSPIG